MSARFTVEGGKPVLRICVPEECSLTLTFALTPESEKWWDRLSRMEPGREDDAVQNFNRAINHD